MNCFKFITLNNGDILLKKKTYDVTKYNIVTKENGDILLKKINKVIIRNFETAREYDFKNSRIIKCQVDNDERIKLKYKAILEFIYKLINSGTKIIKNTVLNIETKKIECNGFYYLEELGISVQGVDSNKCVLEIINQCEENNISLEIDIKLFDDTNVKIVI